MYLHETIGTPCTVPLEPCGAGELTEPEGVAVNEATHDIYVVDAGNHRVQVFHADGSFAFMFGGQVNKSAVEEREAQEAASEPVTVTPAEEDLCTAASGDECQPGTVGTGEGEFEEITGIAVDNACVLHEPPLTASSSPETCEEFDPSNGDLYVSDRGDDLISKFAPAGGSLGSFEGPEPEHRLLRNLAVDAEGHVLVIQAANLYQYSNGSPNELISSPRELHNLFNSPLQFGLAVDPSAAVYLLHGSSDEGRIGEVAFFPPGAASPSILTLDSEESSGLTVDQRLGTAYLDDLTSVAAFATEGESTTELERVQFGGDLTEGSGIAVDASSEFAYVADRAGGRILVMAPRPAGPPTVPADGSVTAVTSTQATLHGEVGPQSNENEPPTTYSFEYGPCPSFLTCAGAPFPFATAPGTMPPDFALHQVEATLASLSPATVYHYRLAAANSHSPEPTPGQREPTLGPELTFTTQSVGAQPLPDDRQWQLVSPPDKLGAKLQKIGETGVIEAAAAGGAITYLANAATEPEPEGFTNEQQLLSVRTASGWTSRDLGIPHASPTGKSAGTGPEYKFFAADLHAAAVQPYGEFIPQLSPQASESTAYLRDLSPACAATCYRPLVTGAPGFANVEPPGTEFGEEARCRPTPGHLAENQACGPRFEGAADDLSHVILRSKAPLATGAGANQLYEWTAAALTQLSLLPGGSSAEGPSLGRPGPNSGGAVSGAVSTDGSRVVFTARPEGQPRGNVLYLRDLAHGETLQLDAGDGCGACESGAGQFQFASPDGSRVFFTDIRALTADSGAEPLSERADLYECRVGTDAEGHLACALADLTPRQGSEPAAVQGSALGASGDGSYLYFVADGILTAELNDRGQSATPGGCQHNAPSSATCNLYLLHDGGISFVTVLSQGDEFDWKEALASQPTRVSPNGLSLAFMSEGSPTGYDNRDLATGKPAAEVYLYDAVAERLRCASCDPSGARPIGIETNKLRDAAALVAGGGVWPEHSLVAADVPAWTQMIGGGPRYQPRYLSDSGRLFFETPTALLPQDSNGTQDVYQYEPPGVGSCTETDPTYFALNEGCLGLISSGTSKQESSFLDASETGDDVFFLTSQRLDPSRDVDPARDVYDAHVCTASSPCLPEPPAAPPICQGDACQQPVAPPNDQTPGSLTFQGAGNLLQCPKGKVRKQNKCVKKQKKKAKHHKHSKKRSARSERGAAK